MKTQPLKVQWKTEKLQEALGVIIDEQNFSPLRKTVMKKKLWKLVRHNRMEFRELDTEWLYRLCAASLMLRDYHWFAWEWRSKWAMEMSTQNWVYPRWDGSKAKVLVIAEQGIGDEIVFSSCYHELSRDVDEAWIEVDPRLIPIFERSFPENLHFIDRFIDSKRRIVPRGIDYPECRKELPIQAFILAGNVPKLYRHKIEDFPKRKGFLIPKNGDKWYDWLYSNGLHQPVVGCSWRGRQGEIDPVGNGVSLQYGVRDHGSLAVPPLDLKWDLEEVFSLISVLDNVVTTTNAVAHMAGAIGQTTHVIKPPPIYATDEDMFNNRVSPWWPNDKCDWYPSVTMYQSQAQWRRK